MTGSILFALMVLASVTPESARFTIRQDGKAVGTEEFSIRAAGKGFVAEGKTRITGDPAVLTSRMELDEKLNPISYEYKRGPVAMRIRVGNPSSELTLVNDGAESSTPFRFPIDAAIVDNNFFHHYLLLLYRVNAANATVPIFVPQDMQSGQAVIRLKGNHVFDLNVGDVKLEATTDANGKLLRLAVPSAKVVVER